MKQYLILAIAVIVAGAYFFGMRSGRMQCITDSVREQTNEIINISDIQRDTDEKVFNTGVDNIRRVLHTKYTIAD